MDEVFKDPVQLTKGINIRELLTSATEFHIDADFKKKNPLDSVVLVDSEDDDSDIDEVFKNIEQSTEKVLLASPEYHTFDELAAKMTDCEPSGAVKMLVIEEGTGPLVSLDAEVTFHYAAYWEKATIPFDCSLTMNFGQPTKVRLGAGKILPGLEIGLTMVRGPAARFHLLLEPGATWGELGAPPRVRPERALFVIVLYDVRDVQAGARFNDLPRAEQRKFEVTMKTVQSLHSVAKDLFTRRKYSKAIKNYQQSISILSISQPKDETETNEVKKLKITTYMNLIVCYYKLNKPKYIFNMLENLDHVIDIETHCKALFYQGRAYEMQGNNEEALKYYKKALKLEPRNKDIGKTLASLDQSVKKSAANEKVMWQNAFQSTPVEKKEKVIYDVDEDFKKCVSDMCEDLAGRQEYAKFDLPTGLMKDEVEFIKSFISDFSGLTLQEDGEGRRKKLYIVKKC